jgi:3-mercaptopyruvate sulfurtransferase SseA
LVYDANRQLDAARLWWLLRYLGVGQVGLIDGGFPLWEKQGRPRCLFRKSLASFLGLPLIRPGWV